MKSTPIISLILICIFSLNSFSQTQNDLSEIGKFLGDYRDSLSEFNYHSIIVMLDESGKKVTTSFQIKTTSWERVNYRLKKNQLLKDLLYIYPKPEKIDINEKNDTIIYFPVGGFTIVSQDNIEKQLTNSNDTMIYKTDSTLMYNGNYGIFVTNSNKCKLSYGWQIPDCFEIISYKCNKIGNWQRKKNFIQYIGRRGDNNFLFEIKFKRKQLIPTMLFGRDVTYSNTIEVVNKNIEIIIKDPQQLDGDIISLNLNGDWIIKGFELTKSRTKLILPLDRNENFLILHAENIGTIYPNTAEIEIFDGKNIQKVILNSAMGKSDGILIKIVN